MSQRVNQRIFVIKGSVEVPSKNPTRLGKMDTIYFYQADGSVYSITVPSETPIDTLQELIRKDFATRPKTTGLQFK